MARKKRYSGDRSGSPDRMAIGRIGQAIEAAYQTLR